MLRYVPVSKQGAGKTLETLYSEGLRACSENRGAEDPPEDVDVRRVSFGSLDKNGMSNGSQICGLPFLSLSKADILEFMCHNSILLPNLNTLPHSQARG